MTAIGERPAPAPPITPGASVGLAASADRREAQRVFLELELRRLRLLLHRRVLWLRRQWGSRGGSRDPFSAGRAAICDLEADALLADPETAAAEQQFYLRDPEAGRLSDTLLEVSGAIADTDAMLEEMGVPAPLERLARLFRLTPFERDVVMLCVAPDLDPSLERLFAYVQDDTERRRPTPFLAIALFAEDEALRERVRDAFLPTGTLRRFRLVSLEPESTAATALVTRGLRIDERLVDYVRGVNRPDPRVSQLLRAPSRALVTPAHRELAIRIAAWVAGVGRRSARPAVNLAAPGDVGAIQLAHAVFEELSLRAATVDAEALVRLNPIDRTETLRLIEREAVLLQLGLYLDAGIDSDTPDTPGHRRELLSLADRVGTVVIVGSSDRCRLERETLGVSLRRPDAAEQRILWERALGDEAALDATALDQVIEQFELGPSLIMEAATAARHQASLRGSGHTTGVTADDLWNACRELTGWQLRELAQRMEPQYAWADLVLPAPVLTQLTELEAQVAHRSQVYERWGFGARLGRGRGIGALFAGPSGTGKTMAAEVIARRLELDLYRIDLAGVVDKYLGESEKRLRRVFDTAERSGAILFFDEADALFGKRSDIKDSHDRYANIEVDYLLQRMEDYRGLAILATNRKTALDRAFLRRLRFLIDFPFPDAPQRRRIWRQVFPPAAELDGIDMDFLSRLELSGGNIRNIALNAAFLAADEGTKIGMRHIVNAASREYAKMDKVAGPTEFGRYQQLLTL